MAEYRLEGHYYDEENERRSITLSVVAPTRESAQYRFRHRFRNFNKAKIDKVYKRGTDGKFQKMK